MQSNKRRRGQGLTEYALLSLLLVGILIVAGNMVQGPINFIYSSINNTVENAPTGGGNGGNGGSTPTATPAPTPVYTIVLGNDPMFSVSSDSGWSYGWYAAAPCRLVGGGGGVTFTAASSWYMSSLGNTGSSVSVNGTWVGTVDGGGSIPYTSGPFPAGSVNIAAYDNGSQHSNGGGGTSLCFYQATFVS
jgi:hypothetical protein